MNDINPYTDELAQKFGQMLFKIGIPSISPAVAIELLQVSNKIDDVRRKNPHTLPPDCLEVLDGLVARMRDVIGVATGMQGEAISKLAELVEGPKHED